MSVDELKRFAAGCRTDPALARLVAEAGTDLDATVAAANAMGYGFSVDDARQALALTRLDELQLAQIAGGKGHNIVPGEHVHVSGGGTNPGQTVSTTNTATIVAV